MAWVKVGDRRLYCFEAGIGRSVILLHGVGLAGISWLPQVPPLVRAGFRVIVPDMVSHGASDPPDRSVCMDDLVGDLRAVMDSCDIARADLVGVSMGGTLAIAAALAMPDRINRLIIANSHPSTTSPGLRSTTATWADMVRGEDGPTRLLDEIWTFSVNDRFDRSDEGRQTYQLWRAVAAGVDGPGLARVLEGVVGFDGRARLPSITADTLFIGGSEDPIAASLRELPAMMPNARYVEIAGARHIANVDEPDAFNRQLLEFLS